jgi:hypothetical protein
VVFFFLILIVTCNWRNWSERGSVNPWPSKDVVETSGMASNGGGDDGLGAKNYDKRCGLFNIDLQYVCGGTVVRLWVGAKAAVYDWEGWRVGRVEKGDKRKGGGGFIITNNFLSFFLCKNLFLTLVSKQPLHPSSTPRYPSHFRPPISLHIQTLSAIKSKSLSWVHIAIAPPFSPQQKKCKRRRPQSYFPKNPTLAFSPFSFKNHYHYIQDAYIHPSF